jgi:hypothetical protein
LLKSEGGGHEHLLITKSKILFTDLRRCNTFKSVNNLILLIESEFKKLERAIQQNTIAIASEGKLVSPEQGTTLGKSNRARGYCALQITVQNGNRDFFWIDSEHCISVIFLFQPP